MARYFPNNGDTLRSRHFRLAVVSGPSRLLVPLADALTLRFRNVQCSAFNVFRRIHSLALRACIAPFPRLEDGTSCGSS